MSQKYDVIIIGSGIGGLTCGAFLARAGMRVLVLEQHTKIGGYAHNFTRRKYVFESGIHSVPLGKDGLIMHLLALLGISDAIEAVESPEMFSITNPEYTLVMPSRKEEILEYLYGTFPREKANIDTLLKKIDQCKTKIIQPLCEYETAFTSENVSFVSQFHNVSYKQLISKLFTDDKLRTLFYGQWPYVGSSPDYAPALFFFMMFLVHFLEGTHYCKNGFSSLADALASVIVARGGKVKTKSRVTAVTPENNKIRNVLTEAGEEYEAGIIVSNISPYILHNVLLPEAVRGKRWLRRLRGLRPSVSCVIVYCGMKPDVELQIPHNMHFWYGSTDDKKIFHNICTNTKETIDHLAFLKTIQDPERPTLTLMNFVQKSFCADWKQEKKRIGERMLAKAEELYPGLRDNIVCMEIGSPDTFERYTLNTDGAIYGFENIKTMYGEAKMPSTTHLVNLYQTGHWGKPGCGIWNVMSNAYGTSKIILQNHT